MHKTPLDNIRILSSETGMVGPGDTLATWTEANRALQGAALCAPRDSGYYKVRLRVTWQDGETYEARVDLDSEHASPFLLSDHVRRHCEMSSGRAHPGRLTAEQWAIYLAQRGTDCAAFGRILDTRALSDAPESVE